MELTGAQSEAVAKLFRDTRATRQQRQEDVAEATGIPRQKIGEMERSYAPNLRFIDVARLARYYKLDLNHIADLLGVE